MGVAIESQQTRINDVIEVKSGAGKSASLYFETTVYKI